MLGLSVLGLVHTTLSLVAVFAALAMFIRGKLVPRGILGMVYLTGSAGGCLTALGLSKHGGFNPGHALSIITTLCIVGALASERWQIKGWRFVQVGLLSTSLFFSLIPAINETLTRVPLAHPLATGPNDPLVLKSLGILAAVFLITLVSQFVAVWRSPANAEEGGKPRALRAS